MLSPDHLAAQLRHPHGEHALVVAESMNRSNGDLNRAAIALLAVAAGWRAHHETGRSNDGRVVGKHFHLLLARR